MPEKRERTIVELVSELTQEVRTLFRQELGLFAAEMKEKVVNVAKDAAAIGAGGFLLYWGFIALVAAAIMGLATVMPGWGAALVVAAVFMVTGFVLVQKGRKDLTQMEKKPEQTTETLKETVRWAKTLRPARSTPRRTRFASKSDERKAI